MATPPYDGAIANYITHPADFCYKYVFLQNNRFSHHTRLPDHVSFDEGAMCEPLSVGIHACSRAGVRLGSHVLIMGAGIYVVFRFNSNSWKGPIGLVSLLAAKAAGATKIVIADVKEDRLVVAKKLGATLTVNATSDVREAIKNAGIDRIDVCIECSGAEPAIRTAIRATSSGGVVVLVGLGPAEIKLPIVDAAVREVDIRGIFRYANW